MGQVVVAAAVQRRAQRGDQSQLVGRVGHGLQSGEHVAHLAGVVHERRSLGPVGDRSRLQGVLQVSQAGAGRDQYGDVPQAGRPSCGLRWRAVVDLPSVPQDRPHCSCDRRGLPATQLLGVGPARNLDGLRA